LTKCYILTEFRIRSVNDDGTTADITDADIVSTIQMPGATFIKNMKILINGREIFNSNQLYSYKAYFDTELSYPTTVKDSFLSAAAYYRDSEDQNSVAGGGYIARKNVFARSRTVQLMTNVDADLFNQVFFKYDFLLINFFSGFIFNQPM
jgi:hypothetical protein